MELRPYLNSLTRAEQAEFAVNCGTTIGYLRKAISVGQKFDVALCVNIERATHGAVRCEELRNDVHWEVLRAPATKEVA